MLSATDAASFYDVYADIMSSNHAPLDEQLAEIHEVLAQAEEALRQLQADENNHNSHPELQATKKSSKIQVVSNFVENLRRVTSPMRRVPPEIIGEILLQTLRRQFRGAHRRYRRYSPWSMVLCPEFEIKRTIPLFPLDVWLSRSKSTCLKISGHLTSWNDDGILFQRVVAESHRWKSLQWSECNFSVVKGVDWWTKPMPRLRKLDVSGVIFDPRRLMSSSPNLTSLSIKILLLPLAHSHDPNPTNTFVHANLQCIATDNLPFSVRYCRFPQLRKLVTVSSNLRVVDGMLCRSQCTLEELDMGDYDNTGNVWKILKG
ncbi:hypothetical protein EDD85DRAFT_983181 [Armillaria nabsnona]|nr:hypothetical protein EDD85DRAFT_983181 [Armillaria nabsnona]